MFQIKSKNNIMNDAILSQNINRILTQSTTNDTQFLASISHEMRTPLNGIIGVIDLLSHQTDLSAFEVYSKTLEQSCRVLLTVVNRLQDISDLQTAECSTTIAGDTLSFDLEAVVTGISQTMQFYNDNSSESTQLDLKFDSRIPRTIKADLTKIQQILTNLCTIAALISTDRYVVLETSLKYLNDKLCTIRFVVKSGNVSVQKNFKLKDHVLLDFEPSDLFDSSTLNNMHIGVNISRKFLQELNQTLSIDQVDKQLHFSFDLDVESQESSPRKCHQSVNIQDAHVHVVDDNSINIMVVTRMLKYLGVSFSASHDGQEVVEKLSGSSSERFDMIFMDLDMPILDGYGATQKIRHTLNNDIVIVALTANSTNAAKAKCKDFGMNDFFTKPITIETLREMIYKWYKPAEISEQE